MDVNLRLESKASLEELLAGRDARHVRLCEETPGVYRLVLTRTIGELRAEGHTTAADFLVRELQVYVEGVRALGDAMPQEAKDLLATFMERWQRFNGKTTYAVQADQLPPEATT